MPSDNLNKVVEEILNQIGYRGFVAGQQKDSENADNLMEQSEISIKRATQALLEIINNEKIEELSRDKSVHLDVNASQDYKDGFQDAVNQFVAYFDDRIAILRGINDRLK